jgi:hypothetical protein
MATLTIIPADVQAGAGATVKTGTAGATITAGQVLYKDTEDDNTLKLADANGAALLRVVAGISLHGSLAGQPIDYITKGAAFEPGATLVVGTAYMLAADVPGGIAPIADAASGDFVTVIGVASSTSVLNITGFTAAGAAKV